MLQLLKRSGEIQRSRGENVTLADAALKVNVPLAIVSELAAIALVQRSLPVTAPSNTTVSEGSPTNP
jgi:hypothetical protein